MVDKRRIYDIASEGGFPDQPARALGDALEDELGTLATKDDLRQLAQRVDHRFNLVDERFDAVDQRFTAQDQRITDLFGGQDERITGQLAGQDQRIGDLFAAQDQRITDLFAAQDQRITDLFAAQDERIDARFALQDQRIEARFAAQDERIDARFAAVDARFDSLEGRLDEILTQLAADRRQTAELINAINRRIDDTRQISDERAQKLMFHFAFIVSGVVVAVGGTVGGVLGWLGLR